MTSRDNFDFFITKGHMPKEAADALVAVGDTMFMARMWLRQNELDESVDNMFRFTELVLRYELEKERIALEESRVQHLLDGGEVF
jgi:hypothetical protein